MSDNQPLILQGSQKFKKAVLKTGIDSELDIKFADENLQRSFNVTKARKKFEERKFEEKGGKIITTRSIPKSNFKKFNRRTISDATDAGFDLQVLSAKFVANAKSATATGVFLSRDELDKLVERGRKNNSAVRWNFSNEQRQLAEQTSQKILQNLEEMKTKIFATSHFEYINREKKYASRGDCIFTSHHLPSWAKDNPKNFFKAADKYEGKNRRRYVEIEFSLPNELTSVEDYKKIIDKFIDHHLKDHYYAYAIHDKLGALSGERHPHCHIMFSERLIDEVEKIKERSPKNYFKYAARKKADGSEPTFQEKYVRGAPKSNKFHHNSVYVEEMRADFAKIQNEILAEKKFSVRVDHRTLKAQREDAINNGDTFLAKLLDREPEKCLSPLPLDNENPRVQELKKNRKERHERAEKFFADYLVTQKTESEKTKKFTSYFVLDSKNFFNSSEVENNITDNLQSLKAEVLKWSSEISALRRMFISIKDAKQQANFEYMSRSEKNLYRSFQDIKSRRDNLQKFLSQQEKPAYDPEKSFDKICEEVQHQIKTYTATLKILQPDFDKLEEKLQSASVKKNVQLAIHNILQQNILVRDKLKIATDNLILATEKVRNEIFAKPKQKYQLREVANILFQHYLALKKDRDKLVAQKNVVTKKILSPARAQKMAENIFVGGDWKKYREDVRHFDKHKNSLHPVQKNYFAKKLEVEKVRLEKFCALPSSQKKIAEITVRILRKNEKVTKKIAVLDLQIKKLTPQINHLYKQLVTLKKVLPRQKQNFFYQVRPTENFQPQNNLGKASIIADAFLGESKAVSQVARITDKGFEVEKDWDTMSDLDKMELAHKRMLAKI